MSVHRRGNGFFVRWRDVTGHNRSRKFDRERDAKDWDAHVRRLRQRGDLAQLDAGTETLAEHVESWWRLYAAQNLAERTRGTHAAQWDKHIEPHLGHIRLRDLDVRIVQSWLADLADAGVGLDTRKRSKAVLSGVIERAVEWGRIPSNPVRVAKLPASRRKREVQPMPPSVVESLRHQLLLRKDPLGLRNATLVSAHAYSGPRPSEVLGLHWRDVRENTLLIHASKTSRRLRTVPLLAPLRADLNEWRMASGRPGDDALVFPRSDGKQWTDGDLRNWRNRIFKPAARAIGITGPTRPYDLRHAIASLWLHEGRSIVEVAAWLGNSTAVLSDVYAHVIEELADKPGISAEDAIREARDVPREFPDAEAAASA
jgi:integrase